MARSPRRIARGFTLLEVAVVMMIIGIVAALSAPIYTAYLGRAELAEVLGLLSAVRTPMTEYYTTNNGWPPTVTDVLATTSSRYTASITYFGEPDDTPPGRVAVEATTASFGLRPELSGRTVLMKTDDGGANWACTSGGDHPIDQRYLPRSCW